MRKCKIDIIIDEINKLRNCKYLDIGHLRYANIAGDGRNYRTVYAIVNDKGGVTAVHNGRTAKETLKKLAYMRDELKCKPS